MRTEQTQEGLELEAIKEAAEELVVSRGSRAYVPAFASTWPFGFYPVGARELEALANLAGVDLGPDYGTIAFTAPRAPEKRSRRRGKG